MDVTYWGLFFLAVTGWVAAVHYRSEYKKMFKAWVHTKDMLFKATGLKQ
jgi:hypothetical protein